MYMTSREVENVNPRVGAGAGSSGAGCWLSAVGWLFKPVVVVPSPPPLRTGSLEKRLWHATHSLLRLPTPQPAVCHTTPAPTTPRGGRSHASSTAS